MKTNVRFLSYLVQVFLEYKVSCTELVQKLETHILCSATFFSPPNIVPFVRSCGKILYKGAGHREQYGACAFHAVYLRLQIHSGCVMLAAFPQQQWLHERASWLLYTYIACRVSFTV